MRFGTKRRGRVHAGEEDSAVVCFDLTRIIKSNEVQHFTLVQLFPEYPLLESPPVKAIVQFRKAPGSLLGPSRCPPPFPQHPSPLLYRWEQLVKMNILKVVLQEGPCRWRSVILLAI